MRGPPTVLSAYVPAVTFIAFVAASMYRKAQTGRRKEDMEDELQTHISTARPLAFSRISADIPHVAFGAIER